MHPEQLKNNYIKDYMIASSTESELKETLWFLSFQKV